MKAAGLRKSILQAAVEGKLVSQDSNDEPASVLLERIKQEKEQLVRDGKIKKDKPLPPISDDEIPFDLPTGWKWVYLGDIVFYTDAGKSPNCANRPASKGEFGVIKTTAVQIRNFHEHENKVLGKDFKINPSMLINEGDILITRAGPMNRTGCVCLVDKISGGLILSDKTVRLNCSSTSLHKPFIAMALNSQPVQNSMKSKMTGMAESQVNIAQGNMKYFIFPLPPLVEQQRIVAKVDELLLLCDELEVAEKELNVLENEFSEYLPKSILQAAVQGKLVTQDPNDEPATELLKRIKQEKEGLIRDGKIKKDKPLPPISEDEIPYDLPNGWIWCHLCELGETNIGLTYKPADISGEGIAVMRSSNVQDGRMDYNDVVYVKSYVPDKNMLQKGDILICARNGSRKLVGKTAIVDRDGLAFGAFMAMFRSGCNPYINAYFASPLFRQNMDNPQTTTINQITQDMLKKTLLPLPPLAEQQRIVAKVDELINMCNELKSAHTTPILHGAMDIANIIPFPQKSRTKPVGDRTIPIGIAARGDVIEPASKKLQNAIDDWDDEDD